MGKKLRAEGTLSEEQVKAKISEERARLLNSSKDAKTSKLDLRD